MENNLRRDIPCSIIILGASGDLCKRKLLPALFSLYSRDMLPENFRVFGFARSKMDDNAFREVARGFMECRYEECTVACGNQMNEFLERCHYFRGDYADIESYRALDRHIREIQPEAASRLFYMSIPPSIFMDTAFGIGKSGIMNVPDGRWSRVVLEKPFGRDSESSLALRNALKEVFCDEQTYRIDHYLGKEVIQNLMILRFANLVLEPLWNRNFVDYVSISFCEQLGLEGRAGYFDKFGIIRDVMQNHLIQILALVAMEQPLTLSSNDIADEKVRALRAVRPLTIDDVFVGQYAAGEVDGEQKRGYLEEPDVPEDSITETYAHATFRINNPRWSGVPFYLSAGKALNTRKTEIHVRFKDTPYSVFAGEKHVACSNDLHIRVQPDEAIELHLANKVPGLEMKMDLVKLNMLYKHTFDEVLPDAYERLLYDVLRGDRSLFIQDAELAVSWDIVTPVLKELEKRKVRPEPYAFGSAGPDHGQPV
jgi:glucose-6-phosphate 1-dehydrogenase